MQWHVKELVKLAVIGWISITEMEMRVGNKLEDPWDQVQAVEVTIDMRSCSFT